MTRILVVLTLVLVSGCYQSHGLGDPGDAILEPNVGPPVDDLAPGTCAVEVHALFEGPGDDIADVQVTATDEGFLALYKYRRGRRDLTEDTAVGRMSDDLRRVEHRRELGRLSFGMLQSSTLEAGGDGRLAVCLDGVEDVYAEPRSGAVVFLDGDGEIERTVPVPYGCADVAFVAGRWAALVVAPAAVGGGERSLWVFDEMLEVIQRVALGRGTSLGTLDRLVAFGSLAAAAVLGSDEHPRVSLVDMETGVVTATHTLPRAPYFHIAAQGEELHVVAGDRGPREQGLWWHVLDRDLVPVGGAALISDDYRIRALAPLGGGLVGLVRAADSTGRLLLLDPNTRHVETLTIAPPPTAADFRTGWFDLAVRGSRVVVSSWTDLPHRPWIWAGRCRVR